MTSSTAVAMTIGRHCFQYATKSETQISLKIVTYHFPKATVCNTLGPVARSMVNVNDWLRTVEPIRFYWWKLPLVSSNHASNNLDLMKKGIAFPNMGYNIYSLLYLISPLFSNLQPKMRICIFFFFCFARSTRTYWENLKPASGRPYCPTLSGNIHPGPLQ